jgi:integrase
MTVSRACKGYGAEAPIGPTKSGKTKHLPLSQELAGWIARHVHPAGQLTRVPLFVNPRTGTRWGHWSLRNAWLRAARAIGLEGAKFYEATNKHTMATAAIARGVNERILQRVLGHADARSTRHA